MMRPLAVIAALLVFAHCAAAGAQQPVVRIGSKASIEPVTLGEMLVLLARDAGADARHSSALGGTQIVFSALETGEIDAYVEYTGTLSHEILSAERLRTSDDIRAALAKRSLVMSEPLGFNNTYAIGMKDQLAEQLGIKTISDLARVTREPAGTKLKFGFSDEFMKRSDGWPAVKLLYKFDVVPAGLDHSLAYRGLDTGKLHVADLYSTDPEIRKFKLRVLEDDLGTFPEYHAVILYRQDLQERAPAALRSMLRLVGNISNEQMQEMNARVRIDHALDRIVAAEFLHTELKIQVPSQQESAWRTISRDLVRNTGRHLFLVFVSLAAAVVIALPLGVWAYKYPKAAHGILSVVGIIQTIPSMAVLIFMVPLLGLGVKPAIMALFLYSLLPIVRNTYAGLIEVPENLRESAIVLGLSRAARLWLVELPIASRSILNGIKTAAVINVGTATIGGLIGAGGYGEPILTGLRLFNISLLFQGAVPAAVLALVIQYFFDLLERVVVPKGLRLAKSS